MNIDDLTIGQVKQIQKLLNSEAQQAKANIADFLVGKLVIARSYSAGVHYGEVVSVDGENVVLKNSVRMWKWKAKDGIALSGLAQNGLSSHESKLDTVNPIIYLVGVCEVIPCSDKFAESIK